MKIFLSIIGGGLGVGLLIPVIFETSDKMLAYLNGHNFIHRLFGVPGAIALVSAFLAGGLLGGFKDYGTFRWRTTVQGESRLNPSYGMFILALIANVLWVGLLE